MTLKQSLDNLEEKVFILIKPILDFLVKILNKKNIK